MDQLRSDIGEFVHIVNSIDQLLHEKTTKNTLLISQQKKRSDILKKSIQTRLSDLKLNQPKEIKNKLMLSRLTDHFNDAQNLLKKLRINQRILELESVSPTGLELANEVQTTTNNLSAKILDVREQFDLDRLRDRQKDIREIENVVTDTNQMFRTLSTIVSEQGETVTNIESHIEQVGQHVTEGALELHRARNYHLAAIKRLLPFAGAAVGAGLSGPIGLATGFKLVGTTTVAVSSIVGFVGGRFLSKKIETKQIETDQQDEHHD